jgi:hypothetical protein
VIMAAGVPMLVNGVENGEPAVSPSVARSP